MNDGGRPTSPPVEAAPEDSIAVVHAWLTTWLHAAPRGDAHAWARLLLERAAPSFVAKVRGERHLTHLLENAAFSPWTHGATRTIEEVESIASSARAIVRAHGADGSYVDYTLGMTWRNEADANGDGTRWRLTGLSPAARTWD